MVILGVLLVVLAVVFAVGVLLDSSEPATVDAYGVMADTTVGGAFATGGVTMLVLLLGLLLLAAGLGRGRRRRRQEKETRAQLEERERRLEEERAALQAQRQASAQHPVRPTGDGSPGAGHGDAQDGRDAQTQVIDLPDSQGSRRH